MNHFLKIENAAEGYLLIIRTYFPELLTSARRVGSETIERFFPIRQARRPMTITRDQDLGGTVSILRQKCFC